MRICSISDCENKHEAKGFCHKHYVRFLKHGDPLIVIQPKSYRFRTTEKCSVINCDRDYLAKKLCRYHYLKNKRINETQKCSIDGCENKCIAKGFCNSHYTRIIRNKPVEEKSYHELSPKERLSKFVSVDESSGCWLWNGGKNKKGYGSIHINGRTRIAHRLSYELYIGDIPDGLLVCHRCDTPSCINPEHLFLGTDLDNSNDKFSKRRERYLSGEENGNSKLSSDDVIKIKKMLNQSMTCAEIADCFDVSTMNINYIKNGKIWSHINV